MMLKKNVYHLFYLGIFCFTLKTSLAVEPYVKLCPEFPETVPCLQNEPYRSQEDSHLCYAYSGANVLTCALRKEGAIQKNESVAIYPLATHYKYQFLDSTKSYWKKNHLVKSIPLEDPIGFGFEDDFVTLSTLNEIPILKQGPDFKVKDYNIYRKNYESYCSNISKKNPLSQLKEQTAELWNQLKNEKTYSYARIHKKYSFERTELKDGRSGNYFLRIALRDTLKRGWPLVAATEDHVITLLASKKVGDSCMIKVFDSATKDGLKWVDINSLPPLISYLNITELDQEQ